MSKSGCMFSTVASCSNRFNNSGIVCDKHYKEIFNLCTVKDKLYSKEGRLNVTKLCITRDLGDQQCILPMPYTLRQAAANVNDNDKEFTSLQKTLCLESPTVISSAVSGFLSSKNLYDIYRPKVIQAISDIIVLWISQGTIVNENSQSGLHFFYNFMQSQKKALFSYWDNCVAYIRNSNTSLAHFHIQKLPVMYQALLVNCEMSLQDGLPRPLNCPPNVLIDLSNYRISLYNVNSVNKFYIQSDYATWGSPLIITGKRTIKNGDVYTPFTKSVGTGSSYNFINYPKMCS